MDKNYIKFVEELKQSIVNSRYVAAKLINREQLLLYYQIGRSLSGKIKNEKWGAKVLEQIAEDLQKHLPGIRGFSHSNLKNMRQFFEEYAVNAIGQSLAAQLEKGSFTETLLAKSQNPTISQPLAIQLKKPAINQTEYDQLRQNVIGQPLAVQLEERYLDSFFGISFSHHMIILNKCPDIAQKLFYIEQAASQCWSRRVMEHHITAKLHLNLGKLANNFKESLPDHIKTSALQVFQDEYLFDFIHLDDEADERVFEGQVVANIKNTIMALGKGFSFIGNQYRLELEGQEFYIDLLFYNRYLQCLVAFELKRGAFKPEYAGQLNFYLNVLDDKVKLPHENPSIGIILCKEKKNTIVEYAIKNIDKGIGAATFKTAKQVPKEMRGILPDAKDLADLL
jgi:predicted nuclease of restriction endonuclease-like (RecB) superfamily